MSSFLIQGFFFQFRMGLDAELDEHGEAVAVVHSGLCRFMFAGIIFPDEEGSLGGMVGEMNDDWGYSLLSDVRISSDVVSFTKRYEDRDDVIHYKFRREGSLWTGEFEGSFVGRGGAKCMITEAPEGLFVPHGGAE
ncbi:MAG TPA: hypothetical protein PLV72_00435 [Candidatus Magasanikbacteria bacterium]|nr:hypothetical protein [Candidatus Magasanikbacteria bacterium]